MTSMIERLKAEIKRQAPDGAKLPKYVEGDRMLTVKFARGITVPLAFSGIETAIDMPRYAANVWSAYGDMKNG